jgi:polysaccharide export outer membrane protein
MLFDTTDKREIFHHRLNKKNQGAKVNNHHSNLGNRFLGNLFRAKKISFIFFALSVLSFAGCSTTTNVITTEEDKSLSHDYLIGPGDIVQIIVWRNPEVSMTVPVRPDGKITTPLVDDLRATGKTSTQLARDIEKMLSKYIQQPVVTVIVTSFVGPYSEQIRVIGQAARPQALPYRQDMSLMDVLITVGGITDFASGNSAKIIRARGGKQQKIKVRLDDLIKDGDISANMQMLPGDILVIPESFF